MRKLLPLLGSLNSSPAGVPVTSPLHNGASPPAGLFLDVELGVGDGFGEIADRLDGRIAAPALTRKVPAQELIVGGKALFLDGFDVASAGYVEEAVAGRDDGAGLRVS